MTTLIMVLCKYSVLVYVHDTIEYRDIFSRYFKLSWRQSVCIAQHLSRDIIQVSWKAFIFLYDKFTRDNRPMCWPFSESVGFCRRYDKNILVCFFGSQCSTVSNETGMETGSIVDSQCHIDCCAELHEVCQFCVNT